MKLTSLIGFVCTLLIFTTCKKKCGDYYIYDSENDKCIFHYVYSDSYYTGTYLGTFYKSDSIYDNNDSLTSTIVDQFPDTITISNGSGSLLVYDHHFDETYHCTKMVNQLGFYVTNVQTAYSPYGVAGSVYGDSLFVGGSIDLGNNKFHHNFEGKRAQ